MKTAEVQQKAAALSSQFQTLEQNFRGIDPAGGYQRVIDLAAYGAKLCKKAYEAGLLDLGPYRRFMALRVLCEPNKKDRSETWKDIPETYIAILDQLPSKAEYDEALNKIVSRSGKLPDPLPDELNEMWDRVIEECNEHLEKLPSERMWPSMDLADMWAGTWMAIVFHLRTDHPGELPCNPFVQSGYLWHVRGQTPRNAKKEWRSLAQNYAIVAEWLAAVMDRDKKEVSGDETSPATKFQWTVPLLEGCVFALLKEVEYPTERQAVERIAAKSGKPEPSRTTLRKTSAWQNHSPKTPKPRTTNEAQSGVSPAQNADAAVSHQEVTDAVLDIQDKLQRQLVDDERAAVDWELQKAGADEKERDEAIRQLIQGFRSGDM